MSSVPGGGARHNPFCSERVRPGSIPYFFESGGSLPDILARWEENGRVGQIVGPHGTGKSTLLHCLYSRLVDSGVSAALFDAEDGCVRGIGRGTALLLDSAERLSGRRVFALARGTRSSGSGLIITAHRHIGLPILARTSVSPAAASAVIVHLLGDSASRLPSVDEIDLLLRRHGGNFRLALFELYDRYEAESRSASPPRAHAG